jgi:hypothetical protein
MGVCRHARQKSRFSLPGVFKKVREWNENFGTIQSVLKNLGLWQFIAGLILAIAVSIWSRLKHLHGPEIFVLALLVLTLFVVLVVHLPELFHPRLKVRLTPINGPSQVQLLAVQNLGTPVTLRAQCRLIDRRNDPNPLHRAMFRLGWDGPQKRAVKLRRGGSCNLVVARASEIKGRQIEGRPPEEDMYLMQIWGLSAQGDEGEEKESSRWYYGNELPETDLEITIVGENHTPYVECFTVKPGNNSASEMLAISSPPGD